MLILDPRRPTAYLQGHLKNAVNLPLAKAFDQDGRLRSTEYLADWLGDAGLAEQKSAVVYDAYDGQNAAMLVWLLEYLGRNDVHVMDIFLERWIAEGRPLFYRPVRPASAEFRARINPRIRATREEVRRAGAVKLTDFRSRDEYAGRLGPVGPGGRAGHIPGAINIVWRELLGEDNRFLAPEEKLRRLLDETGIAPADQVVAYCQSGPRAAVGYLALRALGMDVRLFDGSYAEWVRAGLPVEAPK